MSAVTSKSLWLCGTQALAPSYLNQVRVQAATVMSFRRVHRHLSTMYRRPNTTLSVTSMAHHFTARLQRTRSVQRVVQQMVAPLAVD